MHEQERPHIVGPPETFDEFYERERDSVLGLAFALSGDRGVAEDLTQEAFLAAYRGWGRISAYEQPGAWVRRVVANLSVSAFRRRKSELRVLMRIGARMPHAVPELSPPTLEFWSTVRQLPRRQAQVVALFYLEDLPITEIARILEMASGTVKKHLHDARRSLARHLQIEEEDR